MIQPTTISFMSTNQGPVVLFRCGSAVRALFSSIWTPSGDITSLPIVKYAVHQFVVPTGWSEKLTLVFDMPSGLPDFMAETIYSSRQLLSEGPTLLALNQVTPDGFRVFGHGPQGGWVVYYDSNISQFVQEICGKVTFHTTLPGGMARFEQPVQGHRYYNYSWVFNCSTGLRATVEISDL